LGGCSAPASGCLQGAVSAASRGVLAHSIRGLKQLQVGRLLGVALRTQRPRARRSLEVMRRAAPVPMLGTPTPAPSIRFWSWPHWHCCQQPWWTRKSWPAW
jgi:hypothetical protein